MIAGWLAGAVEIGDPDGERTVVAIVALLAVLGIALIMLAMWMWRVTRPDPELLAPLELMGERSWRRGDPVWQRRRLDEVRPSTAAPLSRPAAPPDIDESFDAGPRAIGVSDLTELAVPGEPAFAPPEVDDDDGLDDGLGDGVEVRRGGTPVSTKRPLLDDLDEVGSADLDPEVIARARAELDEELGRSAPGE